VAATVPGVRLQLNQLLKLQSGLTASALSTSLNVLELAQAVIQVGNGNNAAAAAVDIPLGIANTSLRLKVLQPPQLTAIGDPALAKADPWGRPADVRTAQVRALISVDLPLVGATITALNALLKLISPAVALVNFLTGGGSGYADLEAAGPQPGGCGRRGGRRSGLSDGLCLYPDRQGAGADGADLGRRHPGGTAGPDGQRGGTESLASNAPVVSSRCRCWILAAGAATAWASARRITLRPGPEAGHPGRQQTGGGVSALQPPRLDQAAVWGASRRDNVVQSLNSTLGSLSGLTTLPADPRLAGRIQGILKLVDDILAGLLS
jgi:hypothetical protein